MCMMPICTKSKKPAYCSGLPVLLVTSKDWRSLVMSCSTKLPLSSWIWAKLVWAATSSNHAEELTPDAVGVRAFEGEFVAAESRHRGDRPRAFGHPARLVARQCAHMGRNVAAKLVDCRKIAAFRDAPGFKVRHQELQVHRGAGN